MTAARYMQIAQVGIQATRTQKAANTVIQDRVAQGEQGVDRVWRRMALSAGEIPLRWN